MQILHTGRAGRHAGLRRAVAGQVAHRPLHAQRAGRGRHREADRRLRQLRRAGQAGRLRRRRDHRLGRLPASAPSWCRRPTCAPTAGAAPGRTACASRSRWCSACARRSARDFILIFRISAMDMLDGGLAWDEVVSLGKAVEAAGANIISTHFCWHEAPVPTIATMVPRAAFAQVTGRLRKELKRADDHQQPHQHARRWPRTCWRAATPTWCRWRGRCWPTPSWCNKAARGPRGRDQHLHRLQPGLPGPHLRRPPAGELPGQPARLQRDRC